MQHFNLILIEKTPNKFILIVYYSGREPSGSVVECLTQEKGKHLLLNDSDNRPILNLVETKICILNQIPFQL